MYMYVHMYMHMYCTSPSRSTRGPMGTCTSAAAASRATWAPPS